MSRPYAPIQPFAFLAVLVLAAACTPASAPASGTGASPSKKTIVVTYSVLGAVVKGAALAPEGRFNHWKQLALPIEEEHLDIRDGARLRESVHAFAPEIVFHLAAQPLVRRSYAAPLETWSVNAIGTAASTQRERQIYKSRRFHHIFAITYWTKPLRGIRVARPSDDRLGDHRIRSRFSR